MALMPSHRIYQVRTAEGSGKRDLGNMPRETAAGKSAEAIMASLVVIAVIMTITGVVAGGFIAVSFAISRGHRVRSVIWNAPDRTGQGTRPLTGSSRRA
jgi:hypothetical protein